MKLTTIKARAAAVICAAGSGAAVMGAAYAVAHTRGVPTGEAAAAAAAKKQSAAPGVKIDGLPQFTGATLPGALDLKPLVVHPRKVVKVVKMQGAAPATVAPGKTTTSGGRGWDTGTSSSWKGGSGGGSGGGTGGGAAPPPPPPPPGGGGTSTGGKTPPPPPPPPSGGGSGGSGSGGSSSSGGSGGGTTTSGGSSGGGTTTSGGSSGGGTTTSGGGTTTSGGGTTTSSGGGTTTSSGGGTTTSGGGTTTSGGTTTTAVAAPRSTSRPRISGDNVAGSTLTAGTGTWTGSPTFTITWLRCKSRTCSQWATGTTYKTTTDDIGYAFKISVTATNDGGSKTATSDYSDTVQT